jgi:hypothetical protein
MVTQIRNVLERYRDQGGQVQFEMFEGSGHGPLFDAAERWSNLFFSFLALAEKIADAQTMLRKGSGT